MDGSALESLRDFTNQITDPRVKRRSWHLLGDVVGVSILAVLCGADDWCAVQAFGVSRHDWLKQFFELPEGIPSHDTFSRVMGLISPKEFSACLVNWLSAFQRALKGRVVSIDGKAARGSGSKKLGLRMLHMVSAWANEAGIMLGQVAVDEKSNEITAIPELLDLLAIKGTIVTIDAIGMQKTIVEKIREKKADYVIGLKDNQPTLAADMQELVNEGCQTDFEGMVTDVYSTTEMAHGGIEQRDVRVIEIPADSPHRQTWKDLNTVAVVTTRTVRDGVEKYDTRMYLCSLKPDARQTAHAIRSHWGIENSLHWTMDVVFREDDHRLSNRNGVQNMSAIRRLAVSILRQDKKTQLGAKNKRFKAALNPDYLLEVLEEAMF
jgi:predicted transposase YbfD/YdcC